ncbi:1-phosphatidylinositol-3-phosphate 5-kinase FAB1 [Plectosphaerella plurivora]|uniref:1-phosphatidylinositol-3-phosphate 5-kinase n=1 Tax=Plectosphaerella plurivora TaxID=936078 RepID=A0A9P8UZH4_9PEZI|nr:1-phosphatidylinositol-3-phosphate 5-kinase FAB1 [Plectosphaerella plurivora]
MASDDTLKSPSVTALVPSTGYRSRRGSTTSISTASHIDKEQLAQTLNKIHTSASQSGSLTTFNDYAPPPGTLPVAENKGLAAGDLVQNGFSGLYNRLKEAVGAAPVKVPEVSDDNILDAGPKRPAGGSVPSLSTRGSVASMPRGEAAATNLSTASGTMTDGLSSGITTSGANTNMSDSQIHQLPSSKVTTISSMSASRSSGGRASFSNQKVHADGLTHPTVSPTMTHRDSGQSSASADYPPTRSSGRRSISKPNSQSSFPPPETIKKYDRDLTISTDRAQGPLRPRRDDGISLDGSLDSPLSPVKAAPAPPLPTLQTDLRHHRTPSGASSLLAAPRRPAVIERISRSRSPGYAPSASSSQDHGAAEPSPINTSAHNSLYHESFGQETQQQMLTSGAMRIPGTTGNDGAPEEVNARLEAMRKQILSKEFWMADETCKECFSCGQPFSAFRRKHHCRVCGFIFDSKCTSIISAQKFGMSGTLRLCKPCLKVLNQRIEDSGSDDSEDDSFLPAIFRPNQTKAAAPKISHTEAEGEEPSFAGIMEDLDDARSITTPMMAIPATRRIDDSNRRSAILEIDAPQLSRPSSSRSLRSMTTGPRPQSSGLGHKRHHSRQNFWSRFKPAPENTVPFRQDPSEEMARKSKYPAFHEDNIIDPELAAYMSDESSGDEQMSIFATMSNSDLQPSSFDREKGSFGPFLGGSRKHRFRGGEKSISGLSFTSRGMDDTVPGNLPNLGRPSRRRNLSNVSASVHHHMRSPRPKSSAFNKGPSASHDNIFAENHAIEATKLTRSDSLQEDKEPQVELNSSSMQHVRKLLRQLLEDSEIPNAPAWEKALIPILLQCTDDVVPDVRAGDDMDVRHYVKLKKIPGGKPGDTAYVSGVIFTKNLALKSMPRRILNPRIVLVSFPIEYQRQQQHFMSLQPVIEQEKEFLRVVVNRIINLRPQVLLCEKSVSGVALQYLSEAGIAVAYNVKPSVISAVSRCAETDIITSLDRLALQNQAGRSAGFEVKTYVNKNYPGKKKTYIFLSGCAEQLGCTIALRGDSTEILARMKRITEFMVYVVYNLKLETCLMRDEFVQLPADGESSSLQSSTRQLTDEQARSFSVSGEPSQSTSTSQDASADSEQPMQSSLSASVSGSVVGTVEQSEEGTPRPPEPVRTVSLHASHMSSPDAHVPEDVPMPTYYSDMVARYETKILSASPFVKFAQPYLLMKAREQERRLIYLKRLRDQDVVEEETGSEKKAQKFQLIKPEMVHAIGQKAPRQIMEVLHAVHDAEYDKALHNYQTQTRQWENYIQGNLDLFDPYSHQNIVVLYSEICTETKIPCAEPGLIAISFYDQHVDSPSMDGDCTLGNYIESLVHEKDSICTANGCDRAMTEHHRTYVHDESRITVFVEPAAIKTKHTTDDITMWSYCKICKKDSPIMPMSDSTWNYSFGKYLELLFWSKHLKLHSSTECPHDHRDHIRLFQCRDTWVRIHYDPIDLLEIIVPRARITWKVDNDLKLKNEIFAKIEARWIRFMASVKVRLKTITVDSVLPEKAEDCKTEVERLTKKTQDDQIQLIRRLQETYVNSKYYEVIPFNAVIREMLEAAGEWDTIFNQFEAYFLPDKDLRQLTMIQLKKIFSDNDSRESLPTTEGSTSTVDTGEPPSQTFSETDEKLSTQPTENTETTPSEAGAPQEEEAEAKADDDQLATSNEGALERAEPLDLATPTSPVVRNPTVPIQQEVEPPMPLAELSAASMAGPSETHTNQETNVPGTTLSEKVEQLRREHQALNAEAAAKSENASELARPIPERTSSRKSGLTVSPPLVRATSQPIRTLQKPQPGSFRGLIKDQKASEEAAEKSTDTAFKVDKKISERLGLGTSKAAKKQPPSSIPRFVHKKKESKVFAIAKHFEQLSREFEKERIRENRKKRLAQQPRAFLPRTSTKAIVEVYDDVDDAVQEQETMEEQPPRDPKDDPGPVHPTLHTAHTAPVIPTVDHTETPTESAETTQPEEPQTSGDTDDAATANASQGGSDDEGGASDTENGLDDILPDVKELADALEPSTEIPLELPKHQKKSLMKMLTNFWAERSASGWPLLDYPVNQGDHIFIDSDIIVREDEPSSVIAFALSSDDYCAKLADIRRSWQIAIQKTHEAGHADSRSSGLSDTGGEFMVDEGELEKSLLRATGTHLKYQFKEGSATMLCKIFYAEQFDALRRKCGVADRIIESLSRCLKWDSKGGKTKSVFLKTLDDRLVLKALSPVETSAFLRFAPAYFGIMAEALFHDLPSVIAKMLGFFQLIIKNPVTGVEIKLDLLVMENLFYDRSPSRIFDLKGSMRNRKIQSTGEQNEVLLDENMVEFIYESPLFAREHSKKLLRASVWNDTLFLARQNVMDYSLMIAVDEVKKELVVGIIDCIRTYTWDKKLESWIKDRGFAGGGRNRPTVTSPKEYKSRFREAMARYILQAPNCWHQFGSPQMINALRPRFEIEGKPE